MVVGEVQDTGEPEIHGAGAVDLSPEIVGLPRHERVKEGLPRAIVPEMFPDQRSADPRDLAAATGRVQGAVVVIGEVDPGDRDYEGKYEEDEDEKLELTHSSTSDPVHI